MDHLFEAIKCRGACKRVKVYELRDNSDWIDVGTGHTEVSLLADGCCYLRVSHQEESVDVQSIFEVSLTGGYEFSLHDTNVIIIANGAQKSLMAISFLDIEHKELIWKLIGALTERADEFGHASDPDCSPPTEPCPTPPNPVPYVELSTISEVLCIICEGASLPANLKTRWLHNVVPQLTDDRWLNSLVTCYQGSTQLDMGTSSHVFFTIAKTLLLLPATELIERLVKNDTFPVLLKMLELDGGNYTQFFEADAKFRRIGFPSEVEDRIHETFRIGYLKDVALARFLDDSGLQILSQLCQRNYAFIFASFSIGGLDNIDTEDTLDFLFTLTTQIGRPFILESKEKLLDAVLSPSVISRLASHFLSLSSPSRQRSRCLEVIASVSLMRPSLLRQVDIAEKLCDIVSGGTCEAEIAQAAECLRFILDPTEDESFLRDVYASKLPAGWASSAGNEDAGAFSRQTSLDLLTFALLVHGYFAKNFFLRNGALLLKALRLALQEHAPKIVQLAAVRVLRAVAGTRDTGLAKGLSQGGIWNLLILALARNRDGGSILSAGADLINYLGKEKIMGVIDCLLAESADCAVKLLDLEHIIPAIKCLQTAKADSAFILRVRDSVFLERHDSIRSDEGVCFSLEEENVGKNTSSSPNKKPRLNESVD